MLDTGKHGDGEADRRAVESVGHVIEWAPLRVKPAVDAVMLIGASARLQAGFVACQDGFIRRELIGRGPGNMADAVRWRTLEAAGVAMTQVAQRPSRSMHFALMATIDAGAGGGVEHSHSVGTYTWAR